MSGEAARTKTLVFAATLASEQALIFGREKRAAQERVSERRGREGPLPPFGTPLACLSRIYFSRYPQMESLLRRLHFFSLCMLFSRNLTVYVPVYQIRLSCEVFHGLCLLLLLLGVHSLSSKMERKIRIKNEDAQRWRVEHIFLALVLVTLGST